MQLLQLFEQTMKEQDKKLKSIQHVVERLQNYEIGFELSNTLTGHGQSIWNLKKINDECFISASRDHTLKIWKITGECIQTLQGHSDEVNAVELLSNGIIMSGSNDKKIKLWRMDGLCLFTLDVGSQVLSLLRINEKIFACGCGNGEIHVYDTELKKLKTLKGHKNSVSSLIQLKNGNLVSGSFDNTIKIWDIEKEQCIQTLSDHTASVRSLCLLSKYANGFASASDDKTIKIWNEGKCLNTFTGHSSNVLCVVELENGTIASGSDDETIRIWNRAGKCLHTLQEQSSGRMLKFLFSRSIRTLIEVNGMIVAGSLDKTIKIWKKVNV